MKFATIYNRERKFTCSGTFVEDVDKTTGEKCLVSGRRYTYKQEWDKQGKRSLVISGSEDVYDYIQSFKEDTNIYKILQRLNGDLTKLDSNKGFYADVSEIPRDFYEFNNKIAQGHQIFGGLPTDLKSKFGNSINEFMASIYNKDFESKYNEYLASKNPKKVESVNTQPVNSVESVNTQPVNSDVGGIKNE